jgi:uncharacterized protein (DUF1330 family)
MAAYVVFVREKTTNKPELDTYSQMAPAAAQGHAVDLLALYGKSEVLEGPPMEGAAILQFPTFDEAQAWYQSSAYQGAAVHRFAEAVYRTFIVEGLS